MFCTVYRLRHLNALLKPGDPFYALGRDGLLVYDEDHLGCMCAQLFEIESGTERMRLERAKVIKARDGGVLIKGDEVHFRASKSKGEAYRQTWWCVPLTKVLLPAGRTEA